MRAGTKVWWILSSHCLNPLLGLHWEGIYLCHWKGDSHTCEHLRDQILQLGPCPGTPWLLLAPFLCGVTNSSGTEPGAAAISNHTSKNPCCYPRTREPSECSKNDSINWLMMDLLLLDQATPQELPAQWFPHHSWSSWGFGAAAWAWWFLVSIKTQNQPHAPCRDSSEARAAQQLRQSQKSHVKCLLCTFLCSLLAQKVH